MGALGDWQTTTTPSSGFDFGFTSGQASAAGGAVSALFAASAERTKAQGFGLEQQTLTGAAALARQESDFTELSTNIKLAQTQRDIFKTIGGQEADVGGAGLAASGSALDLLRSSQSQGALQKGVLQAQGLITEDSYKEQAKSYDLQAQAAGLAQGAAKTAAVGDEISAGLKVASMFIPA